MRFAAIKLAIVSILFVSIAAADVPNEITYQGRLKEAGQLITATRTMVFKLYSVSTGGSDIWSSGNQSVSVKNGIFAVKLSPIVDWRTKDIWIETIIDNKILSPREKLTAQVFALHARTSEDIEKSAGSIHFSVGQSTFVTISDSGYVGIGTSEPSNKIDIQGGGIKIVKSYTNVPIGSWTDIDINNSQTGALYIVRVGRTADTPDTRMYLVLFSGSYYGSTAVIVSTVESGVGSAITATFQGSGSGLGPYKLQISPSYTANVEVSKIGP